jgi:nucleotide-binding universal stress UspA family protein
VAYTRILCPIDFSPCSDHAADHAIELAARFGARVDFFHAWDVPAYAFPEGALVFDETMLAKVDEGARQAVERFASRHRREGVVVESHAAQGPAALAIAHEVKALGADLVVIGTHGRTGLSHLVIGSVAERVVRTAGVPVLTVPLPRDAAAKK